MTEDTYLFVHNSKRLHFPFIHAEPPGGLPSLASLLAGNWSHHLPVPGALSTRPHLPVPHQPILIHPSLRFSFEVPPPSRNLM